MVAQEKTSCSWDDLLPLSNSRRINAAFGGILARQSGCGCQFDRVPVDESDVNLCRSWTAFLPNGNRITAGTYRNKLSRSYYALHASHLRKRSYVLSLRSYRSKGFARL